MSIFPPTRDLTMQCFKCSKVAGSTHNLYFSKNMVKRYYVRRNFSNILECLGRASNFKRCLDFGFGMGIMLPGLSSVFEGVIDIDIDIKQLEAAEKVRNACNLKNVQLIVRSEENELTDFDNGSFDCIIADNVLEHITDPAPIVLEFYRILAEGGVLIVPLPSQNAIYRLFENKNDGHVLRTSKQILGLINEIESIFIPISRSDIFPFFITRIFRKSSGKI